MKIYCVEFFDVEDQFEMPETVHVKAKNKTEAKGKARKILKKILTKKEYERMNIGSVFEETHLKLK